MKILKFGGKSLANGEGLQKVIQTIAQKYFNNEPIAVVVSARGNATDELVILLKKAQANINFQADFEQFKKYQLEGLKVNIFEEEFSVLQKLLEGVSLLGDYSEKIKDQVIAYGEILSAKYVAYVLNENSIKAQFTDSRQLIKTDINFGNAQPIEAVSKRNVLDYFEINTDKVNIVTGFIGSTLHNETTTLGRNGSNYTASLLANYLNAEEFQNYTHVDGIFTANPALVAYAKKIERLSFN